MRAINIHTVGEGTGFTLVDNVDGETYEFSVTIPTAGVHTVYDALAAYTAATRLGMERARAARALASYQTTGMRQNIVQHGGVTFIEDCYNASPDSMKAALQILHDRQPGPGGRRIAVLGDMLELGAASEPGHRQTGKWAADAADLPALADKLAHEYDILIATEVGGGVVPMDVKQRADREAAGRLACLLAARAECVVQMFCGIPTVLKGELSQC